MAESGKNAKSQQGKSAGADASPEKTGVPPTRATGPETATGQQIKWAAGEVEVPKGDERGSQVDIEGGDPTPTLEGGDKPRGLQAEDALFSSNGQVASDMEASPTGLQPIGANSASPEEAKKKIEQRRTEHEAYVNRTPKVERLDDATINRLGRAELAAIGKQRGYSIPDAGTRATRAAFAAGQDSDSKLGGSVGQNGNTSKGSQQAPRAKSTKASLKAATRRTAPKGAKGSKKGGRK